MRVADCGESKRIPQFKRAELMRVAPAHGAIHLDNAVGNLGHALGRVEDQVAKQGPKELAGAARIADQRAQALSQVFDASDRFKRWEAGFARDVIFERVQVDRVDFLFLADALVETLTGLFAEPAALHHLLEARRRKETLAPRIGRCPFIKIRADKRHDVEADDIEQAERSAIGKSDQRAGEEVDLFNGVAAFCRDVERGAAEEAADAIRDEVRCVLARDNALAQALRWKTRQRTSELRHRFQDPE